MFGKAEARCFRWNERLVRPRIFSPQLEQLMARSAYDYALDLLAARAYTTRNLRRKMVQKEFPAADIEAAIDRLLSNGLLDDRKFAGEYARQKIVVGGASVRRVKQELARKGIEPRSVDDSIAETLENESVDQESAIERIAVKKLKSLGDLDEIVKRRRLFGFLARRGYDLDDIKKVVGRILQS